MEIHEQVVKLLCNETNDIVEKVKYRALQNATDAIAWKQSGPFLSLNCDQLTQSLPTTRYNNNEKITNNTASVDVAEIKIELDHNLAMQRLSEKLSNLQLKLEHEKSTVTSDPSLKIVVIGGSMTTGFVNYSTVRNADVANVAWPRKLEHFMNQKWHASSVQVINLALGRANEDSWLGRLDVIMEYAPDIILVESVVNDQSDYNKQIFAADHVNRTSHILLNLLMNFPTKPAVINVELFRIAHHNKHDANVHCQRHIKVVVGETCFYCEQWWKPQSWRKEARETNLVSSISYRDAVWLILSQPPKDLCQYWSGMSHPGPSVHEMVASTILFQFTIVMQKKEAFLELSRQKQNEGGGSENAKPNVRSRQADIPDNVCLNHISSFCAVQGDLNDAFLCDILLGNFRSNEYTHANSCWKFQAGVRDKYGWICEKSRNRTTVNSSDVEANTQSISGGGGTTNFLHINQDQYPHLYKKVRIGNYRRVIISRLVSYDERMAMVQVWFSSPESEPTINKNHSNIFIGDPVWNINSWHKEKTSIPEPYTIQLSGLNFKESLNIFHNNISADVLLDSNVFSSGASSSTLELTKFMTNKYTHL